MTMAGARRSRRAPSAAGRQARGVSFDEARRVLVGGVNSPVRAFRRVGGEPLMLSRASGAMVTDHRGRRYIDLIMGWGPLPLGHNHPAIVRALRRRITEGVLLGLTHPAEVQLARLIAGAMASIEQVRFTVSGSEACMTAVRLARAWTGRRKILTFEGCYHGHGDALMAGQSAGLPPGLAADTLSAPFNDVEAAQRIVREQGRDIACIVIEPVAANMGVIPPRSGYLAGLRALANEAEALLILDEVVSGFRVGSGGAQGLTGVAADLTVLGKIIGGGMPIGAVGGRTAIMRRLAPEGDVYHGGTFAGHPLTMAAGVAALSALQGASVYERLEQRGARLAEGLAEGARQAGVPVQVNRVGSMLTVFFSTVPVERFAQAKASDAARFARWANGMRAHGVLVPPSPMEALFVSCAHTPAQLDQVIRASRKVMRSLRAAAGEA